MHKTECSQLQLPLSLWVHVAGDRWVKDVEHELQQLGDQEQRQEGKVVLVTRYFTLAQRSPYTLLAEVVASLNSDLDAEGTGHRSHEDCLCNYGTCSVDPGADGTYKRVRRIMRRRGQ